LGCFVFPDVSVLLIRPERAGKLDALFSEHFRVFYRCRVFVTINTENGRGWIIKSAERRRFFGVSRHHTKTGSPENFVGV
jgi:hypothetical protein